MPFRFTPSLAEWLCSPRGAEWLRRAGDLPLTPATRLSDLQTLRRHLSAAEAAAVVEQTLLRRRGRAKFGRADDMLFTRHALEQATHPQVARHRAARFAGLSPVADLGCGVGGDTLALARAAGRLLAVERDPVRLRFARHNLSVYNLARRVDFLQADILRLPARPDAFAALFADPSRRAPGGRRAFRPDRYAPPLPALLDAFAARPMGVKVGPGLDFAALPCAGEVEVVSLRGEVKEAVLWLGELATPGVRRRATLLPSGITLTDALPAECPAGPLTGFLYEPDAAVIRAGLVEQAGARLGLHRLDPRIAYLCGDAPLRSPLVTGYRVEARLPLRWKAIRRHLRAKGVARLNIKQRGTGLSPEAVAARLKLPREGVERTLILLRMGDEHLALICRRLMIGD